MEFAVIILPLLGALLCLLTRNRRLLHVVNGFVAGLFLLASLYMTFRIIDTGTLTSPVLASLFYLDPLSVITLDTIAIVNFMVSLYSVGYLEEELKHHIITGGMIRIFYVLTSTFVFTMVLVVTTQNLGVMWVAIEATTLASVFLVGFYNNKHAVEAAWKYVMICSVGIAFALLGIILLYFSSLQVLPGPESNLNWNFLLENARQMQGSMLKLAFIFVLVGFGTKVGLVPLHTWLPDAHSQAPSPISALLSGVLLNSAMYGIIRVLAIVNKNLGGSLYTGRLLMGIGLLSIGAAALFIYSQKDYKRLLAYSSIEHMGIIAFGLGLFTPAAVFGAVFHMVNHAFTKSMLFLASGNVYLKYQSREIAGIKGVLKILPTSGTAFLLGLFAIAGLPPFSIFASELSIMAAAFEARHPFAGGFFIILIALVFATMAPALLQIFFGDAPQGSIRPGELNFTGTAVIVILLVMISVSGLYMPVEIKTLFESAGAIIRGGE